MTKLGWPTIGIWLSFLSALYRHLYRSPVGSANRLAVATMVGKWLAQQHIVKPTIGPLYCALACPTMGSAPHSNISPFSVGINIGPLFGEPSGPHSTQSFANGRPNNFIVGLTVGPLHGTHHYTYLLLV